MTEKAPITQVAGALPAVVAKPPEPTSTRSGLPWRTSTLNPSTRRAYAHALDEFPVWRAQADVSFVTVVLVTARGGLDRGANTAAVGANPQTAIGRHTSIL